jgi:regulator of protease activity HflC (stomatin/prohibitin superfamily)
VFLPYVWLYVIILVRSRACGLRRSTSGGVIFRLGRFKGLRGPGLYWIIPLGIERSVTVKVNAVLWYRIIDSAKSVIEVADAPSAVYQLALTGLRNIIGQHDLDEVLQQRNKINDLLRESIASETGAWGMEVQRFEMKDVELPVAMQQVMAMQAEAIREKRARVIKAEAELEASVKLSAAAAQIAANPAALELRRMQMISEVGAENNSTTVIMIPSDFVSLAHSFQEYLERQKSSAKSPAA